MQASPAKHARLLAIAPGLAAGARTIGRQLGVVSGVSSSDVPGRPEDASASRRTRRPHANAHLPHTTAARPPRPEWVPGTRRRNGPLAPVIRRASQVAFEQERNTKRPTLKNTRHHHPAG
jgi:hypothetical protein